MSSMIIKNLSEFLSVLVQTFNLPALFPSIVFTYFSHLFILDALPSNNWIFSSLQGMDSNSQIILGIIIVLVLTLILDSANLKIIRRFEGYGFLDQFPFDIIRYRKQRQVEKVLNDITSLKEQYDQRFKQYQKELDEKRKNEHYEWVQYYANQLEERFNKLSQRYPENIDFVLPFRLGNAIAAAEQYPDKIFGMDAIVLWPFLRHIISDRNYAQFYVRDKATLDFLLNMIVTLIAFGVLLVLTELLYHDFSLILFVKVAAIIGVCYFILSLAIQSAVNWGTTVRTAFVIFKEDLRTNLGLKDVDGYEQEKQLWRDASIFFNAQFPEEELLKLGKNIFNKSRSEK
ncbi:MAG: hypothetical protein CV087_21200 [Candidatus Brocadia sp. WS118]|nr:MAG: hypothetical protein CV087_21200 [Candidatus Brocadia sp. WS118]